MKKLALLLLFATPLLTRGQDYKTAVGLRAGSPFGVTIKHFVSSRSAFEGILAPRWKGFQFTGLIEFYPAKPAFGVPRMHFYFGLGGHLGVSGDGGNDRWDRNDGTLYLGADGIVGLEYNIPDVPINLSVDVKPALSFLPGPDFWFDGAFSIRYYWN